MRPIHILLGIITTAIWGFNFVVLKVALEDIPPLLLTALRFIFSCLPVLFLPKPKGMRPKHLIIVGLTAFLGQYIFLFVAMKLGMPAGLSSVTLQLQVFITILLSIVLLKERPKRQQVLGGCFSAGRSHNNCLNRGARKQDPRHRHAVYCAGRGHLGLRQFHYQIGGA